MNAIFFIAALATALAVSPAWAVNKCTIDGRTVYQEAACPGSGELIADDVARKKAQQEQQRRDAEKAQAERTSLLQKRLQECGGKIAENPVIGMTVSQWQCTDFWDRHGWGSRVNETETASGKRRQHVFPNSSIKYIYTTNGVITAIQR